MKAVIFLILMMSSIQAFAYEEAATVRALESEFSNLSSYSSIEYTAGDSQCDLYANVIAYTAAGFSYECDVCLIADDNLLWDYDSLVCAAARD